MKQHVGSIFASCDGPDGFTCPRCNEIGDFWVMSDGLLRCRSCNGRMSLTIGASPALLNSTRSMSGVMLLGSARLLKQCDQDDARRRTALVAIPSKR
jgi:hypothetical protein